MNYNHPSLLYLKVFIEFFVVVYNLCFLVVRSVIFLIVNVQG